MLRVQYQNHGEVDIILNNSYSDPSYILLSNVLFVEELCMNLILSAVLADHGINTIFGYKRCPLILKEGKETISQANRADSGLYKVENYVPKIKMLMFI